MAYLFEYNISWERKNIFNLNLALIPCVKYEKSPKSGYQEN